MTAGPRRDAKAIVIACKMDQQRRELYVEGQGDRLFLSYVSDGARSPHARIVEASVIDSPPIAGGERGRLLEFARAIEAEGVPIRVMIDADNDRVLGFAHPPNVYVTDRRDLEGYLLREDCFEKLVTLGLARGDIDSSQLLATILRLARAPGLLRALSARDSLDLPFQRLSVGRYAVSRGRVVSVDFEGYFTALMQSAGIPGREHSGMRANYQSLAAGMAGLADEQVAHGKDAIGILQQLCSECGAKGEAATYMLRTAFERAFLPDYPELLRVYGFLRGDTPIP